MTNWNRRFLPYPLLAPWTDDYPTVAPWSGNDDSSGFRADTVQAVMDSNRNINITVKYTLQSDFLKEMIVAGNAKYASVIFCSSTFKRFTTSPSSGEDEDIFIAPAEDCKGALDLIPYVVSTSANNNFISEEHNEEFRLFNPEGYNIQPWSILAVGKTVRVDLDDSGNVLAAIDMVGDPSIPQGQFRVNLDENHIKIHVADDDKIKIDLLRGKEFSHPGNAALFPAIYLHAITEALRNLSAHEDKLWHDTMRNMLAERGINSDDEQIRDNALVHAQALMDDPIGNFIKAHSQDEGYE